MALTQQSLFLYGYTVTTANRYIDFKISGGGSTLTATLPVGYYSLTLLMSSIATALGSIDTTNTYTVTANRAIGGNLQNRITISTSGAYLSLLFSSGTNAAYSCASLIGFNASDYTGATTYTGSTTTGTAFQPSLIGYNFQDTSQLVKVNGKVNMSSSGNRETVIYSTQYFSQFQFKYISLTEATNSWSPLLSWISQGRLIEFTPNYGTPSTFYEGWIERTSYDGNGLGFQLKEMLPEFPFYYDTGLLVLRTRPTS